MSNIQTNYFHRLVIGQKFSLTIGGQVYTKYSKIAGHTGDGSKSSDYKRINSQKLVILVEDQPQINKEDQALIEKIVARARRDYGGRMDDDRIRKGLIAAHLVKPIRLDDLLNTCIFDFYGDIVNGVYRHYDPKTNTIKDGWTAQHSEPKESRRRDFLQLLALLTADADE